MTRSLTKLDIGSHSQKLTTRSFTCFSRAVWILLSVCFCFSNKPEDSRTAMDLLFGVFQEDTINSEENAVLEYLQSAKEQITRYRKQHVGINEDPLKWWRENRLLFPELSVLARERLSIAGTSVPSERLFSAAGNLLSAKRSSLACENVDTLLFLNKNLQLSAD